MIKACRMIRARIIWARIIWARMITARMITARMITARMITARMITGHGMINGTSSLLKRGPQGSSTAMNALKKLVAKLDRLQQNRPWLAFPVAVWKKFGDDQAGNLAALIAYYGFASLFPLLLVFVTVLNIVLANNEKLRNDVLNSAFSHFPVIGDQLQTNATNHQLHGSAPALIIGIILTFLGARGVAAAAQNALNTVWGVPMSRRAGFPWSLLKQLGMILAVGIGLLVTTLLSGLAGASASVLGGTAAQIGTVAVSLVLNMGVFWLGFRLAVEREIKARQMLPSAVLSAIVWQILQLLGTYLVTHTISQSSATYGVFAVVLGLLAWLYLQAQLTLYAVEANVVSALRLWPRSLAPPPLTAEDRRAYGMYAQIQARRPEQEVESYITEEPDGAPKDGGPEDSTPEESAPKDSTAKDSLPEGSTANGGTSTGRAPAP
jgi:YihY family inner membrane protein